LRIVAVLVWGIRRQPKLLSNQGQVVNGINGGDDDDNNEIEIIVINQFKSMSFK
jgi:hypothetical protein